MPRLNENMRLAEATRRFLDRMERQGAAQASITGASYTLARLAEAVKTSREIDPYVHLLTGADLDRFAYGPGGILEGRMGRRVGSSYFNRCRSVLRTFFEYCLLMGWVNTNAALNVPKMKADAKEPPLMLNALELQTLMEHTVTPVERIACALGMNTGLRANDVRALTIFDVNMVSGEIQTEIRKTRDMDVKPITAELEQELDRWLRTYAEVTDLGGPGALPNEWLLVPSYYYSGLKNQQRNFIPRPLRHMGHMHRLVQRPLERMGYPTHRAGFHTLRRSSARAFFEMLRDEQGYGKDHALLVVQTYLNHASTVQTQEYLGLKPEREVRRQLLQGKSFLGRLAAQQVPAPISSAQPVNFRERSNAS